MEFWKWYFHVFAYVIQKPSSAAESFSVDEFQSQPPTVLTEEALQEHEALTSLEVRQFSCETCSHDWWRVVPADKPVSRCSRCYTRYNALPRCKEYGIGHFTCPNETCGLVFNRPCNACSIYICPNCSTIVPGPYIMHNDDYRFPSMSSYGRFMVSYSRLHISTGSTVDTWLSQTAAATGGSQAAAQGGSLAAAQGGSLAAAQGGSLDAATGGSLAAAQGGSLDAATGGSLAAAQGGSLAAAQGGSLAAAQGGSLAAATGGSQAAAQGGSDVRDSLAALLRDLVPAATGGSQVVTGYTYQHMSRHSSNASNHSNASSRGYSNASNYSNASSRGYSNASNHSNASSRGYSNASNYSNASSRGYSNASNYSNASSGG